MWDVKNQNSNLYLMLVHSSQKHIILESKTKLAVHKDSPPECLQHKPALILSIYYLNVIVDKGPIPTIVRSVRVKLTRDLYI